MVGEYWGHGPGRDALHDAGFDALINFEFQRGVRVRQPDALFADYAAARRPPGWSTLSYLSSHDTELFDRTRLAEAAARCCCAPGGVQIFYGDETRAPPARRPPPIRSRPPAPT
jgi:alpha-amylase